MNLNFNFMEQSHLQAILLFDYILFIINQSFIFVSNFYYNNIHNHNHFSCHFRKNLHNYLNNNCCYYNIILFVVIYIIY